MHPRPSKWSCMSMYHQGSIPRLTRRREDILQVICTITTQIIKSLMKAKLLKLSDSCLFHSTETMSPPYVYQEELLVNW